MKKTVRIISLLLSLVIIFFALTSCGGPNYGYLSFLPEELRAAKIIEIINNRIEEADSYTTKSQALVDGMVGDYGLHFTMITDEKYDGIKLPHPTKINTVSYYYDYTSDELNYVMTVVDGYQDGQLFRKVERNGRLIGRLTSVATKEEFIEYNELMTSDDFVIEYEKTDLECTKSKNGSWIIKTTIVPKANNLSVKDYELITDGYEVETVDITVTVDGDFESWKYKLEYNFKKIDGYDEEVTDKYNPSVTIDITVSDINSTVVEKVDLSVYNIIPDVALLSKIDHSILDKLQQSEGNINITLKSQFTYAGRSSEATEFDKVTYSNGDDGFYYSIMAKSGSITKKIVYRDGIKTTNGEENISSDYYEMNFIASLMTGGLYNELLVTNVTQDEKNPNVYHILLDRNDEFMKSVGLSTADFTRGVINITVTMEDNQVKSIETTMRVWTPGVPRASYEVNVVSEFVDAPINSDDGVSL